MFGEGFMNPINQQDFLQTRNYVLGNRNPNPDFALHIGRFYALDGSLGSSVYIDALKPHVMMIAGKRGYGKSYTLGVFLEEFSRLPLSLRERYTCLVIDTLGIFWTLHYPNKKQKDLLSKWNISAEQTPITLFHTAQKSPEAFKNHSIVKNFKIPPSILSIHQWCELFQCSLMDSEGILLSSSIISLQNHRSQFDLEDIKKEVQKNTNADKKTREKVNTFLDQARSWNLFSEKANPISRLIKPGEIIIIDLSYLKNNYLKQTITAIISDILFHYRVTQRKIEEFQHINDAPATKNNPYIWLAIDEAHLFLPEKENSYVKQILLQNWLRQGRQPGLSLMLATQRPSFMDREVFSHCDLLFCHRLTANEDIQSLTRLRPTYMKGDIEETIKKIGTEKGVALLIDDVVETTHIVKIRPRHSWHGGGEPEIKIVNGNDEN